MCTPCLLYTSHLFNSLFHARREVAELTVWDWTGDLRRLAMRDADGNDIPFQLVDHELQQYWDHKYIRVLVDQEVPALGYTTVVLYEKGLDSYPVYLQMCIRDRFLYDIKAMDTDVHKACTGVENGRILENFTRLADRGENIFVRYPYIPGMNDGQVEKIAEFLHRWQQIEAELLPYHKLGNSKYRALEAQNVFEGTVPLKDEVEMLKKKYGFQ